MSSVKKLIDGFTGGSEEKKKVELALETMEKLGQAKLAHFTDRVESLSTGPLTLVKVKARPYRTTAETYAKVTQEAHKSMKSAVDKFLRGTDKDFKDAIKDVLMGVIDVLLGAYAGETKEIEKTFVTVTGENIVRVDVFTYLYSFKDVGITVGASNSMAHLASLSYVVLKDADWELIGLMIEEMVELMKIPDKDKPAKKDELRKKIKEIRDGQTQRQGTLMSLAKASEKAPYAGGIAFNDDLADPYLYSTRYSPEDTKVYKASSLQGNLSVAAGGGTSSEDGVKATKARLVTPLDVAIDYTTHCFYIADADDRRVRKVDQDGVITTVADSSKLHSGTGSDLPRPVGLAVHEPTGTLYTLARTHDVKTAEPLVTYLWKTTRTGTTVLPLADFPLPTGCTAQNAKWISDIEVSKQGIVWLSYPRCGIIRAIRTDGSKQAWIYAGGGTETGDTARSTMVKLQAPTFLASDDLDNLYIVEGDKKQIRKASPDGVVTTVVPADSNIKHLQHITVSGNGALLYALRTDNQDKTEFHGYKLPH